MLKRATWCLVLGVCGFACSGGEDGDSEQGEPAAWGGLGEPREASSSGQSEDPNADPDCCILRTLCDECVCEPDTVDLGHAGDNAACARYLETGSYGCADYDEADAVIACASGEGVGINDERLTCAASDITFQCECSLGGSPYHTLDIPVGDCDTTVFSPSTVCCIEPSSNVSSCECESVLCQEREFDGNCTCGTTVRGTGREECEPDAYEFCCVKAVDGSCVCSDDEFECGEFDTVVDNCSVYDVTCSAITEMEVFICSEENIRQARETEIEFP